MFSKALMLHDIYIMIGDHRCIKASEFFPYSLQGNISLNDVVFYIPGLRYVYNEQRKLLPIEEQRDLTQLAKLQLPELLDEDSNYTIYSLPPDNNLTSYDVVSVSSDYYVQQLRQGKNIHLTLPEIEGSIILKYAREDYIDPETGFSYAPSPNRRH